MLPRIAAMVLNQHHLITPQAAEAVLSALDGRVGDLGIEAQSDPTQFQGSRFRGDDLVVLHNRVAYNRTSGGVAIVPVIGELVNRGAWVGSHSGMTSYEGLQHVLRTAADDKKVKAIVLDIDSPGGMVAGAFETASLVREISHTKPVTAVANSLMASAAYLIASGANRIVASETGQVGSIGVLFVHVDRSGELASKGQRVTLIHAGKHKVDGHPFGALPEQVRIDIQARGDAIHGKFIDAVVAGRPRMKVEDVRSTEARVFTAEEARANGLSDDVGTFDQAIADAEGGKVAVRKQSRTQAQPGQSPAPQNDNSPAKEAARMQNEQVEPGAKDPGGIADGLTQAQIESLATAMSAALAQTAQPVANKQDRDEREPAPAPENTDAAVARGRTEERARINAILGHAEAKERPVQARVLALESDATAEQAASMLSKMPKESAGAGAAQSFYAAMAANGANPKVRLEGDRSENAPKAGSLLMGSMTKLIGQHKPAPAQR